MHEILTVSLSHRANHLATHFFNQQEQRLSQQNRFLKSILTTSHVSYEPRALLFDVNGGSGSLAKYEFFENPEDVAFELNNIKLNDRIEVISKPRLNKNEYQQNLDLGKPELNQYLSVNNTEYWSDYCKMIFNPDSLVGLANWEYSKKYPQGSKIFENNSLVFDNFDLGVNEWKDVDSKEDVMDAKFRRMIESCDLIDGINIITDIDSGWSGITDKLLNEIRDEFLPKGVIFTWGLYNSLKTTELSRPSLVSRIKSTVELSSESSLFIPVNDAKLRNFPKELEEQICGGSLWHQQYLNSILYENLNAVLAEGITMYDFKESLLNGENDRNIVSDLRSIIGDEDMEMNHQSLVFNGKGNYFFSKNVIVREMDKYSQEEIVKLCDLQRLQEIGVRNINEYEIDESYSINDAAPQFFQNGDRMISDFGISDLPKQTLREYGVTVSRFVRGDERDDLKEKIANMVAQYEYGYSDDDESD